MGNSIILSKIQGASKMRSDSCIDHRTESWMFWGLVSVLLFTLRSAGLLLHYSYCCLTNWWREKLLHNGNYD